MIKATLQQMVYFKEVANLASFTAAANSLGCSTTAVVKAIKTVETSLGQTLVLRGNKGVELTAAGASYLQRVLPIMDLAQAAEDEIAIHAGDAQKILTISSIPSAAAYLLPRATGPLIKAGVRIQVISESSAKVEKSVLDHKSHLGILGNANRILSDQLKYTLLAKDYFSLIYSKKFMPEPIDTLEQLVALKDFSVVAPSPGTNLNDQAKMFLRALGFPNVKNTIETDSMPFLRGVLEEMPSVGVMPSGIARALYALGGLNYVSFDAYSPEVSVGFVTRRSEAISPTMRQMISNIKNASGLIGAGVGTQPQGMLTPV